jgi:hypothetical protein
MTLEFSQQIKKKTEISYFMKIRPIAEMLFEVDRHDEANVHFCNFVNVPKTGKINAPQNSGII